MAFDVLRDNVTTVKAAAAEDFRDNTIVDKAVFAGSSLLLGGHEICMEYVLARVGIHSLEYFKLNPIAPGTAMMLTSGVVETALTYGVAHSLASSPRAMDAIRDRYLLAKMNSDGLKDRKHSLARGLNTVATAFSLGSPGVILNDLAKHPDKTEAQNRRTGLKAMVGLAATNLAIGTTMGYSGWIADRLGTPVISEDILKIGNSPYLTPGLLGSLIGIRSALHLWNVHKLKKATNKDDVTASAITGMDNVASLSSPIADAKPVNMRLSDIVDVASHGSSTLNFNESKGTI